MELKNFHDVQELKNLTNSELQKLSQTIRDEIYQSIMKDEGHLGSNLASTDLTISLLKNFNPKTTRYLFDTGYQAYAFKMLTDRPDFLARIHQPNGYSIFQETKEGDPYSGGHTAVSAAWASGYNLLGDKLTIEIIGDGSLASSVGLGGMLNFAKSPTKGLFILNDNKQGIGINQFNYLNWKQIAQGMGYEFFEVKNGHDYDQLQEAWDFFAQAKKSVFVKVNTIKGYGIEVPNPDEAMHYYIKPTSALPSGIVNPTSWFVSQKLESILKNNPKAMLFVPGMMYVFKLTELAKKYPDQIIDAGIAEEVTIIEAAAAAQAGREVYVMIFSSFFQRTYDQIIHDIMRNSSKIKILIPGIGVTTTGDSHHGIYDLNIYNGFNNISVFQPATTGEFNALLDTKFDSTVVIRLDNFIKADDTKKNYQKWELIPAKTKSKKLLISYGDLFENLKEYVETNHLAIDLLRAISLNPVDQQTMDKLIDQYDEIYTYEPVFWKNNLATNLRIIYQNKKIVDFSFKKSLIGSWDMNTILQTNEMDLPRVFNKIIC